MPQKRPSRVQQQQLSILFTEENDSDANPIEEQSSSFTDITRDANGDIVFMTTEDQRQDTTTFDYANVYNAVDKPVCA